MDQTHVKGTHTNNTDQINPKTNPDRTSRMTREPEIITDTQTPDTNTRITRITRDNHTNQEANGKEWDHNTKWTNNFNQTNNTRQINNINTTSNTKWDRNTSKDNLSDQMGTTDRNTNTNSNNTNRHTSKTEQTINQMTLDQTEGITITIIIPTITETTKATP